MATAEVEVGGRRIRYLSEGHGPALVLVHGLLGWSFSWRHNIGPLSRSFRVYAPDLPGCGHSDSGLLSLAETGQFVAEFVRAVNIDQPRAHLVGTSSGGLAALLCAAAHPEVVGKLVLAAPVNPFSGYGKGAIAFGGTVLGQALLRAAQLLGSGPVGYMLRRRLYAHPERVSQETVAGYAQPLARRGLPAELRSVFARWEVPSADALARISHPVLLLWGAQDRPVPVASGRGLANLLKARLEVIPQSGHLPYEEEPEVFNRLVLEFLLE